MALIALLYKIKAIFTFIKKVFKKKKDCFYYLNLEIESLIFPFRVILKKVFYLVKNKTVA